MRFDPRKGLVVCLAIMAASALWFAALWLAEDALFATFGFNMHPITFLAIFAFFAGAAVAAFFWRLHHVRMELLDGRRVIARWRVDKATFSAFVPKAKQADRKAKLQALALVSFFIVVIFGAFALFDPDVAPFMMTVAAFVLVVMVIAFWAGQRAIAAQLVYRGGEAIIGPRGLLFNGVLHVWGVPLSWLSGAELAPDGRTLAVVYAFFSRIGAQGVAVLIPVPPAAEDQARKAEEELQALAR